MGAHTTTIRRLSDQGISLGRPNGPVNSPEDRPTELTVVADNEETEVLSFGPVDQHICQADAFGAAVRSTRPAPTPLDDAIADMTIIDAVFASAASGGWCAVC